MIHRLIEFSIRHRWWVIAASVLLAIVGGWCVVQTPMDAIPDLSESQVIVFADWSGRAPEMIEDQVTRPLARHLQGLPGVRVVRSSSDFGYSMIHVVFEDHVDIVAARRLVSEQLAGQKLSLPAGVVPNLAPEAPATGQIFWYVLEGRGYDLGQLRDLQDWHVKPQLASVDGIAEVASVGGFPVEYHIAVDPRRLAANELSLRQVIDELAQLNVHVGGSVLQSPTAEYLIRVTNSGDGEVDNRRETIRSLENLVIPAVTNTAVRLADVARISAAPGARRGVLEQEGREVVGGVILMRYGENPVEVIRRIREKIIAIQPSLPAGARIVTSYDRTPLIHAAIRTLSTTLIEAMLTATICVLVVMRHFRASLVISLTLPLSVLSSFVVISLLRAAGFANIETNIMSLAGLVISIGVLVDSSIVMAENVMHTLHRRFGSDPVRGDIRAIILPACKTVGRPIFFSVLIMLLSFLPVFTLGGLEGKMFRPLALTKSFALGASAILAITLVPALCSLLVRGRLRGEREIWLVRSLIDAYRPLLSFLLDRPAAIVWIIAVTFVVGFAPLGSHPQWAADWLTPWTPLGERPFLLLALILSLVCVWLVARHWWTKIAMFASLIVIALIAERAIQPLSSEFLAPLDEQTLMDMPITVPRASVSQSADDLIARDMILCRFPEVDMVMGKAGRADTPTDPAPIDMIETMVGFRPRDWWPRRKLPRHEASRYLREVYEHLVVTGMVDPSDSNAKLIDESLDAVLERFDVLMREYAYQRNQEHIRGLARELAVVAVRSYGEELLHRGQLGQELGDGQVAGIASSLPADATRQLALNPALERVDELIRNMREEMRQMDLDNGEAEAGASGISWFRSSSPIASVQREVSRQYRSLWKSHIQQVNRELAQRGPGTFSRLALEDLIPRLKIRDQRLAGDMKKIFAFRASPPKASTSTAHHGIPAAEPLDFDPLPALDRLQRELTDRIDRRFSLERIERSALVEFGGEMDRCLQMPGWTNVWTRPIQNRVDMLATGVNTTIGIRVLGNDLDRVVSASEQVADVVKQIDGATNVVADPIRGKGYLTVQLDSERMARAGVSLSDANALLGVALGGVPAAVVTNGQERHVVRVILPPDLRNDLATIRSLKVPVRRLASPIESAAAADKSRSGQAINKPTSTAANLYPTHRWVTLDQIAEVNFTEGPATIKGENGLLRNYVRLNVRGRDPLDFVAEARRIVAEKVELPPAVFLEWTGQFEHQQRARRTLSIVLPVVILCILAILYFTYHDFADALLMLTAVPGAIAGGLLAQWLLDYKFSVTVWVGYIACFGMATSTGIIMLVYLRQAVEQAGGLENMTLDELREAVIVGAVQRLRPKLLTEATTIIGLTPLIWASGVGAEVIRPMIAPVLGGILIADEVIDLFIPVMFYWVRRARWIRLRTA